jgi:hypothetical protein
LTELFQLKPEQVLVTNANDRTRRLKELTDKSIGTLPATFPRMFVVPTTIGYVGDSGYRARQMKRVGVYVHGTDNETTLLRKQLIPCQLGVNLFYQDDNFDRTMEFALTWVSEVVVSNKLNFTLEYGGVQFDIKVMSESSVVDMPELDATVENSSPFYEMSLNYQINGYGEANVPDANAMVPIIRSSELNLSYESVTLASGQVSYPAES